jgi:hypothetical protein
MLFEVCNTVKRSKGKLSKIIKVKTILNNTKIFMNMNWVEKGTIFFVYFGLVMMHTCLSVFFSLSLSNTYTHTHTWMERECVYVCLFLKTSFQVFISKQREREREGGKGEVAINWRHLTHYWLAKEGRVRTKAWAQNRSSRWVLGHIKTDG